jgi:hypothetical protein
LFDKALKTNEIATLKLMCQDISKMHLGEILCYFFENFKLGTDLDCIVPIIFDDDMTTIAYMFEHCVYYRKTITGLYYERMLIGGMHSGNLDLVGWLLGKCPGPIKIQIDQTLFSCLLRCNHLETAQKILAFDPSILTMLTMNTAFYTKYDAHFPAMPKINLETYEFCLQIFNGVQGDISYREEIFSDEVLEKYFK